MSINPPYNVLTKFDEPTLKEYDSDPCIKIYLWTPPKLYLLDDPYKSGDAPCHIQVHNKLSVGLKDLSISISISDANASESELGIVAPQVSLKQIDGDFSASIELDIGDISANVTSPKLPFFLRVRRVISHRPLPASFDNVVRLYPYYAVAYEGEPFDENPIPTVTA